MFQSIFYVDISLYNLTFHLVTIVYNFNTNQRVVVQFPIVAVYMLKSPSEPQIPAHAASSVCECSWINFSLHFWQIPLHNIGDTCILAFSCTSPVLFCIFLAISCIQYLCSFLHIVTDLRQDPRATQNISSVIEIIQILIRLQTAAQCGQSV